MSIYLYCLSLYVLLLHKYSIKELGPSALGLSSSLCSQLAFHITLSSFHWRNNFTRTSSENQVYHPLNPMATNPFPLWRAGPFRAHRLGVNRLGAGGYLNGIYIIRHMISFENLVIGKQYFYLLIYHHVGFTVNPKRDVSAYVIFFIFLFFKRWWITLRLPST